MSDLSKSEAEALWASLCEAFANVEQKIIEVIERRAWEPLGYSTFHEAWADRMRGIRLATDIAKAYVVHMMYAEGMTNEQIISAGVAGDRVVDRLTSAFQQGIPPQFASTRVRSHDRALPGQAERLHVTLTHSEVMYFKELSDALGLDRDEEAAKAIRAHFRRLERAPRNAASA